MTNLPNHPHYHPPHFVPHHHDGDDHDHGWDLTVPAEPGTVTVGQLHDVIELNTVGVDVGSSTSHVMFGRVRLERMAQSLSSRYVVVDRRSTWRSPIMLTPYASLDTIDADALDQFFQQCFHAAGIEPSDVDTGVVILTGEALKRRNARAIASLFADTSGRFVCALAGHHREAVMAALGSGAAVLSREIHRTVLNIDVGGGTTKLALLGHGEVKHTAAVAVGGRLLVTDADDRVVLLADPLRTVAAARGLALEIGDRVTPDVVSTLVDAMVDVVVEHVTSGPSSGLGHDLLLTEPLPLDDVPAAVTFSGGVAEYVYGRESASFDDLGRALGAAFAEACASGRIPYELLEPEQGIRATAVGLSQFSVQVSGNTISLADDVLPMRNIPVIPAKAALGDVVDAQVVADAVRLGAARADVPESGPIAVAFAWTGEPEHARLHALAEGVRDGVAATEWAQVASSDVPLVVLVDADVARSLGRIFSHEVSLDRPVVCLDGIEISDCDYVDVGEVIEPGFVVPVIVKSLLFDGAADSHAAAHALGLPHSH